MNTFLTYRYLTLWMLALALLCGESLLIAQAQEGDLKAVSGSGSLEKSRPANPVVHRSPQSKLQPAARRRTPSQPTVNDHVEEAIEKGNEARDAKPTRYAEAETAYRLAARLDPKEARAHYGLGNLFYDYERYTDAVEEYKQAIQLKSDYSEAYSEMARAYLMLDSCTKATGCKEAEEAAKQALRINPVLVSAYSRLCEVYNVQERHEEAAKQCKQAVRLKPDDARLHFDLGDTYYNLKAYGDAVDAYKEGLRLKPDALDQYSSLATSYLMMGQYEGVAETYKQLLRLKPDDADIHQRLGEAYAQSHNLEGALEEYRILKRLNKPSNAVQVCAQIGISLNVYDKCSLKP